MVDVTSAPILITIVKKLTSNSSFKQWFALTMVSGNTSGDIMLTMVPKLNRGNAPMGWVCNHG